jgi:hypothetical protein
VLRKPPIRDDAGKEISLKAAATAGKQGNSYLDGLAQKFKTGLSRPFSNCKQNFSKK